MSVAFRRDNDEEHLEPRFELPIPPGPNLVTARGLQLIGERVDALEEALRHAPDADATAAIKRDLRYWRTRRATAELVQPASTETVAFGCTVRIRLNGRERCMTLVGHDEADAAADRIACTAPLARALMGAAVGDYLPFAGREDAIEVLAITASDGRACD